MSQHLPLVPPRAGPPTALDRAVREEVTAEGLERAVRRAAGVVGVAAAAAREVQAAGYARLAEAMTLFVEDRLIEAVTGDPGGGPPPRPALPAPPAAGRGRRPAADGR